MLENIHRVCFVVPALDEAAECTELEKNKHKFGISKLDAPHIFRESAEEVVGPMLQILRQLHLGFKLIGWNVEGEK